MRPLTISISLLALSACASPSLIGFTATEPTEIVVTSPPVEDLASNEAVAPLPRPPLGTANTAETLDTTTSEDRAEALDVPSAPTGEASLGTSLATLGAPSDPGIWLKTPLVSDITEGRISYQGTSINVELRPSGGEAGSGSQISLPAMRLIGAPLTEIIVVEIFSL